MTTKSKQPTRQKRNKQPKPTTSSRETSPTVATAASKLLRTSNDPTVRKVAASAVAQSQSRPGERHKPTPLRAGGRVGNEVLTFALPAFDAVDFTRTIIEQCVGEISFNFETPAAVAAALAVVATLDGYVATANGLHVTVRRDVDA